MRVIIAGAMAWKDEEAIRQALRDLPKDTVFIHGDCAGADALGGKIAAELGYRVEPYAKNQDDYQRYKRGAWKGLNERMIASGADLVLAFHEGFHKSGEAKGTKHLAKLAAEKGIEVRAFPPPEKIE